MAGRRALISKRAALLATLAVGLFAPSVTAAAGGCEDAAGLGYICGLEDPEDLLRIEGTPFVLTSGIGDLGYARGGVFSVDTRTREARKLAADFSGTPDAEYRGCPGPPDRELFSAHGIDIVRRSAGSRELLVVNHGGRESIESFRVRVTGDGPSLIWTGCVVLPDGHRPNSVAALPQGGFVTTVPVLSDLELLNAAVGLPTGAVLRWSTADGWRPVPGVNASYPNGILVSPDAKWIYIGSYSEQAVLRVSLGREPVVRRETHVDFGADNLRWGHSGEIVAVGQAVTPVEAELLCVRSAKDTCDMPTGVATVDPETMSAAAAYRHPGDERFGFGTAGIVIGDELWLGSARARRVLRVPLRSLATPLAAEPAAPAPQLRLARRCTAGGRVRASVTGETELIGEVRFQIGSRTVARDKTAPFIRTLGRGSLRSSRPRQLRAVAISVFDGSQRTVLRRSLPGCARTASPATPRGRLPRERPRVRPGARGALA